MNSINKVEDFNPTLLVLENPIEFGKQTIEQFTLRDLTFDILP